MSILDLLDKDRASRIMFEEEKEDIFKQFEAQKESIASISNTNWFREIVKYWQREKEACQDRLRTMKSDNIWAVQWELEVSIRFLEFLDNILKPTLI